jgi:hypothetical protein
MISTELIGMVQAQGECLAGVSQFLQTCDNLADAQNMARLFKAYVREKENGSWGEDLDQVLMKFGAKLSAGETVEKDKEYTTAERIGWTMYCLLSWEYASELKFESELEFLEKLLSAIYEGYSSRSPIRFSAQESATIFLKKLGPSALDALATVPAKQASNARPKRPSKPTAKGRPKKAA